MSSCLSSRACGFDLEHMVKWQPYGNNSSRTNSNTSSPSSTLSDSPIAILNQKPRTPRKRPNQTYNEAAALLSMASPTIFKIKYLTKRTTSLSKSIVHLNGLFVEPHELIFSNSQIQQPIMKKPTDLKITNLCQNAGEIESGCVSSEECLDDFDTESILNEEIEQGIDSIMGDCKPISENQNDTVAYDINACYEYPMGLGFGVRALKNTDDRNWWNIPMVEVVNASPAGMKKAVKELRKPGLELRRGLVLKLNYDGVLNDWAGKGLPLPEEISHPGDDIHVKAANIDLFSEDDGWKESSATRPLDKNHLKKIRPVKSACLDKRPRCKGRFVKKSNSSFCD